MWPEQRRLVAASRPGEFFGEQVADGDWFDGVCADVAAMGYEVGAAVLPAASVGFDHARQRLFFVGHTNVDGESGRTIHAEAQIGAAA
jgi:DNA (cytosine-5)-methyltransferase 1